MLISTISYNAIPLTTVFSQLFTFILLSRRLLHTVHTVNTIVCIIKSFLYHDIEQALPYNIIEFFCHNMSYVMTIMAFINASQYVCIHTVHM